MSRLKQTILRLIHAQGPLSIGEYMRIALLDPSHGYYMARDPLARDFITAPEVSQIFGELIGLFFVQVWEERGRPGRFHLVELGPGRGTLMADLLRAAKVRPGFGDAAQVHLIEVSPALRAIQTKALAGARASWGQSLDHVPRDAPLFLVANEFFDTLAFRQFVRMKDSWHERRIGADGEELIFVASRDSIPDSLPPRELRDAPEGAIFETSPASQAIAQEIGRRIAERGGVALIVDYGHAASSFGDTFQAVKAHLYADPLAEPGDADLTAHVDFAALAAAAREGGARIHGPVTQAAFLDSLGISQRAERLKVSAPQEAAAIDAAIDRLTGAEQMGTLFKVLALAAPDTPMLPGFPC